MLPWVLFLWLIGSASFGGSTAPRLLWHVEAEGIGTAAAVGNELYFLTRTGALVSVEAESGRLRWRSPLSDGTTATLGSTVLIWKELAIAGEYDVVAVDRNTGKVRWRFVPAVGYGPGIYLGAVLDDVVFAGSPAGVVYAIQAQTGRMVWSARVAALGQTATAFSPAVSNGRVIAGYSVFSVPQTGGGQVTSYDISTKRRRWTYNGESGSVGFRIAANDSLVFVPFMSGQVVALRAADGAPVWQLGDGASGFLWPPLLRQPGLVLVGARGLSAYAPVSDNWDSEPRR